MPTAEQKRPGFGRTRRTRRRAPDRQLVTPSYLPPRITGDVDSTTTSLNLVDYVPLQAPTTGTVVVAVIGDCYWLNSAGTIGILLHISGVYNGTSALLPIDTCSLTYKQAVGAATAFSLGVGISVGDAAGSTGHFDGLVLVTYQP